MREIKFRAWDKSENCWTKQFNIDNNGMLTIPPIIIKPLPKIIVSNIFDRFEIMQFTGLKDINNKEIYHGDIVKFKPCNDISLRKEFREQEVIAQIIWDNELAKFDVDWSGHAEYHSEFPYFKMEVIGNKFKNPELLK